MNSSDSEQFECLYRRLWGALHKPDDPDLSQHERMLLHHVPDRGAIALTELARHLALPKSSASVVVKDLARRGFLTRTRDPEDERRLRIELTSAGRERVQADTVLEPARLASAFGRLDADQRAELLATMGALADAAEGLSTGSPRESPPPARDPGA
ncbi:MAG TPA: MarR family transcriptional regulator [Solirubrobacteraceae bacterium]|nr:MarR family transcriptional regulator [Solirubrobacteraceae bacterium]